jgi:hypothetical protein
MVQDMEQMIQQEDKVLQQKKILVLVVEELEEV